MNIENLIQQMTLEEKASLCSGKDNWHTKAIERLGIPSIMLADGPHGLRKKPPESLQLGLDRSVPATCFPTAAALAATWNRELIYEVGVALAEECLQEKVAVILGPGTNIKRSPLCGRNFEYFSEDPYLSGEIAKSHIQGVQSKGIGCCLKHFAVNNQETRRMSIDVIVDERTLREIYLTGFEIAIKDAQPWTVMGAYNSVNGYFCCEHTYLNTDILRGEWEFEGMLMSDWGAMVNRVEGLRAGVELEMPGVNNGNDTRIVEAVRSGRMDQTVLDLAVERILGLIKKTQETELEGYRYDHQAHHALARRVAGEGAVLLKNENSILPIQKNTKVALIGRFAKYPRYQGAGSSLINPTELDNLHDEAIKLVGEDFITYAAGYTPMGEQIDEGLIKEAIDVAKLADVVVICAGLTDVYEVEGLDRKNMKLTPGHDALIEAIASTHHKVIVVLSNGSPVEMPWVAKVDGILEGYLGGQAGGGAIAGLLFGKVNPSGKLAESFPIRLEDNPSYHYFPSGPKTVEYRESIYIGYRYYDSVNKDVQYPFGHGLSYTNFEYSDLQLSRNTISDDDRLTISLQVKNSGSMAGKEIVQVYIHDIESSVFKPDKELKGFQKVALGVGESKKVTIELGPRSFAYYNPELKDWYVEPGEFEILVGASSGDIRLSATIQITSNQTPPPFANKENVALYYDFPIDGVVNQQSFEALLGRSVPENGATNKPPYTQNTPIADLKDSFVGGLIRKLMERKVNQMIKGDPESATALMYRASAEEAPLRFLTQMGEHPISGEALDALLLLINGSYLKGLGALLKAILIK